MDTDLSEGTFSTKINFLQRRKCLQCSPSSAWCLCPFYFTHSDYKLNFCLGVWLVGFWGVTLWAQQNKTGGIIFRALIFNINFIIIIYLILVSGAWPCNHEPYWAAHASHELHLFCSPSTWWTAHCEWACYQADICIHCSSWDEYPEQKEKKHNEWMKLLFSSLGAEELSILK